MKLGGILRQHLLFPAYFLHSQARPDQHFGALSKSSATWSVERTGQGDAGRRPVQATGTRSRTTSCRGECVMRIVPRGPWFPYKGSIVLLNSRPASSCAPPRRSKRDGGLIGWTMIPASRQRWKGVASHRSNLPAVLSGRCPRNRHAFRSARDDPIQGRVDRARPAAPLPAWVRSTESRARLTTRTALHAEGRKGAVIPRRGGCETPKRPRPGSRRSQDCILARASGADNI